jgi:hypothetical protein
MHVVTALSAVQFLTSAPRQSYSTLTCNELTVVVCKPKGRDHLDDLGVDWEILKRVIIMKNN